MINKLCLAVLAIGILFSSYGYNGSTTATTVIVGGIIKNKHVDIDKKYKRKDCPVCKGQGWYISGDKISKVPCGYCEPDNKEEPKSQTSNNDKCKTIIIRK